MDNGHTLESWYRSLPPLTRFSLTVTFVVTLCYFLGLINPANLVLDWYQAIRHLQIWRLLTDYFFAGSFGIGWLMHCYFLVTFSSQLEMNDAFRARPGSYLEFIVFQAITLDVISLVLYWPTGKPVLGRAMIMAIIYYWSRREPYGQCGIWTFQMPAYQFPFALIFLDFLMGHSLLVGVMGLCSGHLYYFLKDVLPVERNVHPLKNTPIVFAEIMRRASMVNFTNLSASFQSILWGTQPPPVRGNPAFPGVGRRLGG